MSRSRYYEREVDFVTQAGAIVAFVVVSTFDDLVNEHARFEVAEHGRYEAEALAQRAAARMTEDEEEYNG